MDWFQVLFLFFANASLIVWFRSESRSDWRHMDAQVRSIQEEIKDFHGRMERQDAEFKAKIERQDAEFKQHMMYYHARERKE